MFKKKKIQEENHMSYFFGGTAIGIAAGLLAGKLFLNTSTERNQKFESEILANKNVKKNSQDDNTRNKYLTKKDCTISKSAAQYIDNNYAEKPLFPISSNAVDDELKYNMNNLNLNCKYDKDDGVFYDKNCTLFNISIEDNNKYNISTNIFSENVKEKTKNNSYFKFEDIKQGSSCVAQLENTVSIKDENLLKTVNEKRILITESIDKSIELTDTFNNLSINFNEDSTTYKNLPHIESSEPSSNISSNYIDNVSDMATCNDTTYSDNEERNILNFTSMEEFCETGIISSTKYNFDDI
ncbi:hypothetical protein K0M31_012322 [Melipona bicolor]|uniref:Uncharacterized protein n=1 Tax=Melipona bicolor TaxID=60889 RepID=A0AA40KHC8_9HYME|nr:hypothetical protein K0M31_012322 [Melipona bicolor]